MLVGKYCFNRYCEKDSLILYKNNKYKHKLSFFDGRIVEDFGMWKLDSVCNRVTFDNFIFYNDDGSQALPGGLWISNVELIKGKEIRLLYSRDENLYYNKR